MRSHDSEKIESKGKRSSEEHHIRGTFDGIAFWTKKTILLVLARSDLKKKFRRV